MALKLMSTHTLMVTRYDLPVFVPSSGTYLDPTPQTPFEIVCSLQPMRQGDKLFNLPDGITARDARIVITAPDTPLRIASQHTKEVSDTVDIGGLTYEAFDASDWTGFGLKTDHHRTLFVRKDLIGGA